MQHTDLATVFHSPDLDLSPYTTSLEGLRVGIGRLASPATPATVSIAPEIYLLTTAWWKQLDTSERTVLRQSVSASRRAVVVAGGGGEQIPPELDTGDLSAGWLDLPVSPQSLRAALRSALTMISLRLKLDTVADQLDQRSHELREVHRVGMALSAERDMEVLQGLVVRIAREMTRADAGTLYLIEAGAGGEKALVFSVAQNDSVDMPSQRIVIPITPHSMAGYVAITGEVLRLDDVYSLPEGVAYTFNPALDKQFAYHSRSMLSVPMRNHRAEVIGVLQLINRKRQFDATLRNPEAVEREVEPFTEENERLLLSFASQAAVAIENKVLLDDIEHLLAGFVRASVTAIESRDPATSGHSDRVARLTVGLARAVSHVGWRGTHFSAQQIREIEYAGLLHDFGKVGVREHVLVKARKLYDWKMELIRNRFQYAASAVENRYLRRKLEYVLAHGRDAFTSAEVLLDGERARELADLDAALAVVVAANEPTVLEEDRFQTLLEIATRTVPLPNGELIPLLGDDELTSLQVRRGSLDEAEIREIQSHVTHSFNFLIQIPWTRELQGVPGIAVAHHEKLNGTGYPFQLQGDQIPVQARMMTIADIFDALAAQDRPYKPPVPVPRALEILAGEARSGNIDPELLQLFVAQEVYRVCE